MLLVIIREVAKVLTPSIMIYCLLFLTSVTLYPSRTSPRLDVSQNNTSFLKSAPAFIVYKSTLLSSKQPIVVLIGPSNVEVGFDASVVSRLAGKIDVHKATLGGTNVTGMSAVIDLIYASRPTQGIENTVFVLGLWYGEFLHAENSKAKAPITQQMMRFGLFKPTVDGYTRSVPPKIFDTAVSFLRPFFLLRDIFRQNSSLLFPDQEKSRVFSAENGLLNCAEVLRKRNPKTAKTNPAIVNKSQFEALVELSGEVARKGGRLVLVDLPIPRCHQNLTRYWQIYQDLKTEYLSMATANGALYLNFQDMDDDRYFVDLTHPSPDATDRWSQRLSKELLSIISPLNANSENAKLPIAGALNKLR